MQAFEQYIQQHHDAFIRELQDFCAQPSISPTGEGIPEMADLVRQKMRDLGAAVQTLEIAPGAPDIVYATLGQGDKTLLIYNHYDVQPPEPLDLWESPPFEPTLREGHIYGRGVSDNKGHLLQRIQAIRAYEATVGPLPFRINWFIEGEEEIGSPHLESFCEAHPDLLQADACLWEMSGVNEAGLPTFALGTKGLLYVELQVRTLTGDQHSAYGTLMPNAAWRLTWALSTLKAPDETILIDGFMDDVLPPSEVDLALLEAIPFEDAARQARVGITQWVTGVSGLAAMERHIFQPTCTICGLESGYTGPGQKTVLPATARAKVGFRLVPDMDPHKILVLLRQHLDKHGFEDIQIQLIGAEKPGKAPVDSAVVRAAQSAARQVYNAEPSMYPLTAGTGPVWPVAIMHGTPLVNFGCAHPGTNLHAPNENLRVSDYVKGIHMMGHFIAEYGT